MPRRPRQLDLFARPHIVEPLFKDGPAIGVCKVCGQLDRFGGMTVECPGEKVFKVREHLGRHENWIDGKWRKVPGKQLKRSRKRV